jgi:DNA-directed RNA polymerase beta' subunit
MNYSRKKNFFTQINYIKNFSCCDRYYNLHKTVFPFILFTNNFLIMKLKLNNYTLNKKLFIVSSSYSQSNEVPKGEQMSLSKKQNLSQVGHDFSKTDLNLIRKIITTKNFTKFVSFENKQNIKNSVNNSTLGSPERTTNNQKANNTGVHNKIKTTNFRITNQNIISYDKNAVVRPLMGNRKVEHEFGPFLNEKLLQIKAGLKAHKDVYSQNFKINKKTNVFFNKTYQKIQKQNVVFPSFLKDGNKGENTNTIKLTTLFPFFLHKKFLNFFKKNGSLQNLNKKLKEKPKLISLSRQKNLIFSHEKLNNNNVQSKKQINKNFQNSYSKMMEINLLTISLASANRIRQWAEKTLPNGKVVGEVINPETVHYKTLKPIKGGLFCERIFGPLKDHECACGKKFNIKNYLLKVTKQESTLIENNLINKLQKRYFCRVCDVEYTYSIIRRTQLGFIQLASPTTHVWFVKGIPSYIGILLDLKKKHLQNIIYNTAILTLEHAFRGRQFLPSSPSSIFESWQKIMKTHYPNKYLSPTNTHQGVNVNIFKNSKTLSSSSPVVSLLPSFGDENSGEGEPKETQNIITKKNNKKEIIINKKIENHTKQTVKNLELLFFYKSKNWQKNQTLLYQQNRKKYYFKNTNTLKPIYLKSNFFKSNNLNISQQNSSSPYGEPEGTTYKIKNKIELDVDQNGISLDENLQNKLLVKLISKRKAKKKRNKTTLERSANEQSTYLSNTKGWFKFISHILTKKNFQVKRYFESNFNNIYVSRQDDLQLLITLLVKKFDWSIHFLMTSQFEHSIYKDLFLSKHKLESKVLNIVNLSNLAFFYNQIDSVLEEYNKFSLGKPEVRPLSSPFFPLWGTRTEGKGKQTGQTRVLTIVQEDIVNLLQNSLKIKIKKLFIFDQLGKAIVPLYLLYFAQNKSFFNVLRTKLVYETYNILLPVVGFNSFYKKHENGRSASNKNKKTNKIFFSNLKQKRKKIGFLMDKKIDIFITKQFCSYQQNITNKFSNNENTNFFISRMFVLFFNTPLFVSEHILSHSLLKLWKLFIKQKQTTICFLNSSSCGTRTITKKQIDVYLFLEYKFFFKEINFVNYSVGSLEMLNSFTNYLLQNKLFSSLKRKPNTAQVLYDLKVNLNIFTKHFLKSLVAFTYKTVFLPKGDSKQLKNFNFKNRRQNKKNHSTLFILTQNLKISNFNFLEKYTTKLAVMLLLNLTHSLTLKAQNQELILVFPSFKKDGNKGEQTDKKQKLHTNLTSISGVFNSLKDPIKRKSVQKLHSCYLFNQGLLLKKKVRNITKNRVWKNQTKIQYILRHILQQKIRPRRGTELGSLIALYPAFNFLKTAKNLSHITIKTQHLNNFIKVKHKLKITSLEENNFNSSKFYLNMVSYLVLYALKYFSSLNYLKILTLYFFFFKPNKKILLYNMYYSLIVDFKKLQNKNLKALFVLKTLFNYKIKIKTNKLTENVIVKKTNDNFSLVLTNTKLDITRNFRNAILEFKNLNRMSTILLKRTNNFCWKSDSKFVFKNSLAKTKKLAEHMFVNNIYCISHRELWEQEKDWQDFSYYYYSPTNLTDIPIPLYKHRNYDLLLSIDNSLTNTAVDNFSTQTRIFNLNININTAFSGAGLIQKLLNEFNYGELKKMDKQNRILLFEYNKHIKKLKKKMNSGLIKSRQEYYKACHIRDVLIRRTKLTRKIFNKIFSLYTNLENNLGSVIIKQKHNNLPLEAQKNTALAGTRSKQLSQTLETNGLNMILTLLPVLPPVLRPVLKMGGQFTISDLNRLYQRIIYRNERLKKFLKDPALSSSFEMKYAQRLLQEAVDNLIQNGKSGVVPEKDTRGRLLKSLSDILKGKQGRFRQYLLGKRVDYSGRSVIVVGPRLKLHECGIPKEMALVLYSPFLIKRILNEKLADTYLAAKKLIKTNPLLISQLLQEIMKACPVLLNRAPTLHRLGFQAFQPKLVDGKAILLHPLVCPAFNADFDGDQMAVHIPITFEARAEAWKLMLARNNLLSPATGDPIILPSQDMVLGCYYLTTNCSEKWSKSKKGSGMYFHNINNVLKAYYQQLIHLHAIIWINLTGHVENANTLEQPLEIRLPLPQFKLNKQNINKQIKELKKSQRDLSYIGTQSELYNFKQELIFIEIYSKFYNILNLNGIIINQIIRTTPGKILFNMIIKNAIEKRPILLAKYSYQTGLLKNELINTFNLETTNFFIKT